MTRDEAMMRVREGAGGAVEMMMLSGEEDER